MKFIGKFSAANRMFCPVVVIQELLVTGLYGRILKIEFCKLQICWSEALVICVLCKHAVVVG